jgi:hypothetical protein
MYVYNSYLQVHAIFYSFLGFTITYECRKATYAAETLMNGSRLTSCIQTETFMHGRFVVLFTNGKSCGDC